MDHEEITRVFLNYFERKKHLVIPGASIIPGENDTSTLFVNAGMYPLKPYFLGILEPPSKRLADIQRCVRTIDIERVGNARTLTFFHMLGSWSIGDYWKEEAVELSIGLLRSKSGFGLDESRLWVTVFAGDAAVPRDVETRNAWLKVGMPPERIVELPAEDNFWTGGPTGPCGPCTEVYFDRGETTGCGRSDCRPGDGCERFLEIWNAGVFMMYDRDEDGKLTPLPIRSVDTGAGLERLAMLLQDAPSVYETSLFLPIVDKIRTSMRIEPTIENEGIITRGTRIIADHSRASVLISAAGVKPGKTGREYVLRRLLRRMIRYALQLGIEENDMVMVANLVIDSYKNDYPDLEKNREQIVSAFTGEYDKFSGNIGRGTRKIQRLVDDLKNRGQTTVPAQDVFQLYDTFGFPMEMTKEITAENGLGIDEEGFNLLLQRHQEKSRKGAEQKFRYDLSPKQA